MVFIILWVAAIFECVTRGRGLKVSNFLLNILHYRHLVDLLQSHSGLTPELLLQNFIIFETWSKFRLCRPKNLITAFIQGRKRRSIFGQNCCWHSLCDVLISRIALLSCLSWVFFCSFYWCERIFTTVVSIRILFFHLLNRESFLELSFQSNCHVFLQRTYVGFLHL